MAEGSQLGPGKAGGYNPWATYTDACGEARRRGDRKVGTEHLVLALLRERALADSLGVDLEVARVALEEMDGEALTAVGLGGHLEPSRPDPPAVRTVRRPSLKQLLRNRVPLTPAAKTVLEQSWREMNRRGSHRSSGRVLAELLELQRPDPAAELFARLGVEPGTAGKRLAGG